MPGFSTYSDIVTALGNGGGALEWHFNKAGPVPQGAGQWCTCWYSSGAPGVGSDGAAAPGGTAYTSTDTTSSAFGYPDTTPKQKHIVTVGLSATQTGSYRLVDRLVAASGVSITTTGAKTINTTALPRYTDGANVEAWVEVTTATTTTACNLTLSSYTNQNGTAGRAGSASMTFPAAATVQRWKGRPHMATGDSGVRSVQTITVNTASAAGVIQVVLQRTLVTIPLSLGNVWYERDMVLQGLCLPRVFDGASLSMEQFATGTGGATIWGSIIVAAG